jgi:hypothetical protein
MAAGCAHVIVGMVGEGEEFTIMLTLAVALVYALVSVGVKVMESVCVPACSTVPAGGL